MLSRQDVLGFKSVPFRVKRDVKYIQKPLEQTKEPGNEKNLLKLTYLKSFLRTLHERKDQQMSILFARAFLAVSASQ